MSDFVLQNMPDGTTNPAWVAARRGCLGASKIADILKVGPRGGVSKTRTKFLNGLVAERVTGIACNYINPSWDDIQRGLVMEPIALAEYEIRHGVWLEPPAWITHPEIEFSGATPDSRIGMEGLVQVKCPRVENYIEITQAGVIPSEYLDQMYWEMACCPWAKWNDYAAFNNDMPAGKKLWTKRLMRDDERVRELEEAAKAFLKEVDDRFTAFVEKEFK